MSQEVISYFSEAKAQAELKKIAAILKGPFACEFHDFLLALGDPEIRGEPQTRVLLKAFTEILDGLKAEKRAKTQTSRARVLSLVK